MAGLKSSAFRIAEPAAITQSNAGHDQRRAKTPARPRGSARRSRPSLSRHSPRDESRGLIRSMHGGRGREVLDTARRFSPVQPMREPGYFWDTL
jgi:hypothetical protein